MASEGLVASAATQVERKCRHAAVIKGLYCLTPPESAHDSKKEQDPEVVALAAESPRFARWLKAHGYLDEASAARRCRSYSGVGVHVGAYLRSAARSCQSDFVPPLFIGAEQN